MAGFDESIDPILPVDPATIKPLSGSTEEAQLSANRKRLEQRIRSYQAAIARLQKRRVSVLTEFEKTSKSSARAKKTKDELDESITMSLRKVMLKFEGADIDLKSALDNIRTWIETNKEGTELDSIRVQQAYESFSAELEKSPEAATKLAEELRSASQQALDRKEQEKKQKQTAKDAAKQKKEQDAQAEKARKAAEKTKKQADAEAEKKRKQQFAEPPVSPTVRDQRRQDAARTKQEVEDLKEEAARFGERVRDQSFQQSMDAIGPASLTELALDAWDSLALLGRRGSLARPGSRRERINQAAEAAQRAGKAGAEDFANLNVPTGADPRKVKAGKVGGIDPDTVEGKIGGLPKGQLAGAAASVFMVMALGNKLKDMGLGTLEGASSGSLKAGDMFKTLLPMSWAGDIISTLETIADNTSQEVMGFSPELIMANVDRQMTFLEQNMERGAVQGPMLARVFQAQTKFQVESKKASDAFFNVFAPTLLGALKVMTDAMAFLANPAFWQNFLTALKFAAPWLGAIISILENIASRMPPPPDPLAGRMGEIDSFLSGADANVKKQTRGQRRRS